jgi:FkbM family methyltransferase
MTREAFSRVISNYYNEEMARKCPFRVTLRILKWQFYNRILGRDFIFSSVSGTKLKLIRGASDSLSAFWYHDLPDFAELTFALHLLRPGELALDIGANQGAWSLVLAGRGARVTAFEPIPDTRAKFEANLALNSPRIRGQIEVLPFALGSSDTRGKFTHDLDSANHQIIDEPHRDTVEVEIRKGVNVLSEKAKPVFIKIDVEGFELDVVKGLSRTLRVQTLNALVIETFRKQNYATGKVIELEQLLAEYGFSPVNYDPWRRKLSAVTAETSSQNTIYIRDIERVSARIKEAKPLIAHGLRV